MEAIISEKKERVLGSSGSSNTVQESRGEEEGGEMQKWDGGKGKRYVNM